VKTENSSYLIRLAEYLDYILPPKATDVRISNVQKLKEQGATSVMYSFTVTCISEGSKKRKDFILRLYKEGNEKNGPKELLLLKTLKEHNLPVPTAYYFEANSKILGKPFLILEKIEGKNAQQYLTDDVNAQLIIDKMAENLAKLHKLDPNCIQNTKTLQQLYEIRQHQLSKIRFFIKKRCINFLGFCPPRQRKFIAAVKRLADVKPIKTRPAILHMDYEPDHIIVSDGQFIIVDWGDASIGDPAFDVAWTYHKLRLGRETAKVDLGEYFVKRYEKYMEQRLVNLQFYKNMVIIELALKFGLTPFKARADLWNYAKIVDLFFGDIIGKLLGARSMRDLRNKAKIHHWKIWSNIEYIHDYAIRYLERTDTTKIS
jgi:aminoglycoside phosphotransferase (APT) family kinase protein